MSNPFDWVYKNRNSCLYKIWVAIKSPAVCHKLFFEIPPLLVRSIVLNHLIWSNKRSSTISQILAKVPKQIFIKQLLSFIETQHWNTDYTYIERIDHYVWPLKSRFYLHSCTMQSRFNKFSTVLFSSHPTLCILFLYTIINRRVLLFYPSIVLFCIILF